MVDIRNGDVFAFVKFEGAVQEIFAVELLPDMNYPDLINDIAEVIGSSYELSDSFLPTYLAIKRRKDVAACNRFNRVPNG